MVAVIKTDMTKIIKKEETAAHGRSLQTTKGKK
jgi:hypothetical protein